jgi:nitrogen fixation protein NifZ
LVEAGEIGEVMRVLRDHPAGVAYEVHFADRPTLQVPESALIESARTEGVGADTPGPEVEAP